MKKVIRITLALVALAAVLMMTACASTPNAGEIGVIRSGKSIIPWTWFNGHQIKGIVPPNAGMTWTGFGSSVHYYPADTVQRNYTISDQANQGDQPGVDIVTVPTSDGVNVGLNGTFYFTTAFNATPEGERLVKDFDNRFGVRTFTAQSEEEALHPYEGTNGWSDFLATVVRPVINNDLRATISTVTCAELVSSCALVHQSTATSGFNNNASIEKIQETINNNLKTDIKNTLGEDYFSNISFLLSKVILPTAVQNQIDNSQAQYAAVAAASAKVKQAEQEAHANEIREKGYAACGACATIDALKAIPSNVTTFAPGAGFAITK